MVPKKNTLTTKPEEMKTEEIKLKWQKHNQEHGMSWNEIAELVNEVSESRPVIEQLEPEGGRTEQYPIVCPSCEGSGYVSCSEFNPNVTGSAMNMVCPACNGGKIVIVTRNY